MSDAIQNDGRGFYMTRDPRSRLPVSVDWTAWLAQEGTTLQTSTWSADSGLVLDGQSLTPQVATAFISGGLDGGTCTVRNTITTANGLSDSRSLRVYTKDR